MDFIMIHLALMNMLSHCGINALLYQAEKRMKHLAFHKNTISEFVLFKHGKTDR